MESFEGGLVGPKSTVGFSPEQVMHLLVLPAPWAVAVERPAVGASKTSRPVQGPM